MSATGGQDTDPQAVTSISGYIDGTDYPYEFSIVSLEQEPEHENSAKLQITVTLANGTVLRVPDFDNYTIIQNPL